MGLPIYTDPVFRIRQDATASLILLWKVTATGFQQCSLIDGRSVTLLQAPGGLVLLEEMLALGPNHFIGELWKSPTQHHVSVWCVETVYKEFSRIICILAINTVPFILGEVPLILKIAFEGNMGPGFLRLYPSPGQSVSGV